MGSPRNILMVCYTMKSVVSFKCGAAGNSDRYDGEHEIQSAFHIGLFEAAQVDDLKRFVHIFWAAWNAAMILVHFISWEKWMQFVFILVSKCGSSASNVVSPRSFSRRSDMLSDLCRISECPIFRCKWNLLRSELHRTGFPEPPFHKVAPVHVFQRKSQTSLRSPHRLLVSQEDAPMSGNTCGYANGKIVRFEGVSDLPSLTCSIPRVAWLSFCRSYKTGKLWKMSEMVNLTPLSPSWGPVHPMKELHILSCMVSHITPKSFDESSYWRSGYVPRIRR